MLLYSAGHLRLYNMAEQLWPFSDLFTLCSPMFCAFEFTCVCVYEFANMCSHSLTRRGMRGEVNRGEERKGERSRRSEERGERRRQMEERRKRE